MISHNRPIFRQIPAHKFLALQIYFFSVPVDCIVAPRVGVGDAKSDDPRPCCYPSPSLRSGPTWVRPPFSHLTLIFLRRTFADGYTKSERGGTFGTFARFQRRLELDQTGALTCRSRDCLSSEFQHSAWPPVEIQQASVRSLAQVPVRLLPKLSTVIRWLVLALAPWRTLHTARNIRSAANRLISAGLRVCNTVEKPLEHSVRAAF